MSDYIIFYNNGSVIDDRNFHKAENDYIDDIVKAGKGEVSKIYRRGDGIVVYEKDSK